MKYDATHPIHRQLALAQFGMFVVAVVGVIVLAWALIAGRYILATVAVLVVAVGLPAALRIRGARAALKRLNDQNAAPF